MVYKNFEQLIEQALHNSTRTKKVAVIAAEDSHTIQAVCQAAKNKIVCPLLIGRPSRIKEELNKIGEPVAKYTIINAGTVTDMVLKALDLIELGEADFLMKGMVQTAELMRSLLKEKKRFCTGRLLSHLSLVQIPNYHKLVGITDVALNICPDVIEKKAIVENTVNVMLQMGFDQPKVGILAANEQVNPKMQETVDADELKRLNRQGVLPNCFIEGPISYDLMMSGEAARVKGYDSPVCGDVDLMVVPNIASGNILLKALRYSAHARSAGLIIGGKVPIVLTSRSVEVQDKYLPIILAASAAR